MENNNNIYDKHQSDNSKPPMTLNDAYPYNTQSSHTQGNYTVEDYRSLPDDQRVELIDGYFFNMETPPTIHQRIVGEIYRQIANYIRDNNGKCIPFISPVDVQIDCDEHTMVQPDVAILCHDERLERRCIFGAPDFALEVISPSTKRKDSIKKLHKYDNAGVCEYWIVDPYKKYVLVYFFEDEENAPTIYGFENPIPVNIYDGKLTIKFDNISKWIDEMEND